MNKRGLRIALLLVTGLVIGLVIEACSKPRSIPSALPLSQVLGGDNTAGFLRAETERTFSFPADHAAHPGFRNEWWYVTGNLQSKEGRRFGYQVTFFNAAILSQDVVAIPSAWASDALWMGHLALTDVESGKHYAFERFTRENPGLAGVTSVPFKLWLEDWQLASVNADADFPWQLHAGADNVRFDFVLTSSKLPVLQGERGLSRKNAEAGNASYYYSMTRLATQGELRLGDEVILLTGDSWLDREWSTSALGPNQQGWDWFSLQFNAGQELMYYNLRDGNGASDLFSQGNWTDIDARQTRITPADIRLAPLAQWTSPTGVDYDTRWRLQYGGRSMIVEALVAGQYMALSIPYWEGAVRVLDEATSTEIGWGYLEMVRE
jgi:predicted secreted hydrolase